MAAAAPYTPPDLTKPLPQYDQQRQQAQQASNAQKQTNQDALTREYSRLGGLNSGSYIKSTQVSNDQSDQNLNQANQSINAQEDATKLQLQQTQQAQAYQTSEREAGQQFQTGLIGQQQKFATGEREGTQQFQQGLQSEQLGQQQKQFQATQDFNNQVQGFNQSSTLKQLDLAQQQFQQDTQSTQFNKLTAVLSSPDWRNEVSGLWQIYNDPSSSQSMKAAAAQYLRGLSSGPGGYPTDTATHP